MKESEVVLNGVQAEIGKLEEEENDLQKDVVDVRHELERIEGIVKSNKLKVKHWRKEVTDLYPLGGGRGGGWKGGNIQYNTEIQWAGYKLV